MQVKCPTHTMQVVEFACIEPGCQNAPLLCYVCKDYGRHKGHRYNLLEVEAEEVRTTITDAVNHLKKFMEEITETARKLGELF